MLLDIEGSIFEVTVWGTAEETIVALPGLGTDTSWYQFLAPKVAAAGFRFIAMNPRGIGGSSGTLDNLSMETMANDVADVIRALGLEKVHLIGWAFGNRIARSTAARHPNRVASLGLLAAGGRVQPAKEALDAMNELISSDHLAEDRLVHLARTSLYSPSSDVLAIRKSVAAGKWPQAREAQLLASNKAELSEWWSGGNARMLVVQGLDDKMAVPENGYVLKEEFPERVTLVGIHDAGHMLLVEQADKVAQAIVSFLARNPIAKA